MIDPRCGRSARIAVAIGLSLIGTPVAAYAADTTPVTAQQASVVQETKQADADSVTESPVSETAAESAASASEVSKDTAEAEAVASTEASKTSDDASADSKQNDADAQSADTAADTAKTSDGTASGSNTQQSGAAKDADEAATKASEGNTSSDEASAPGATITTNVEGKGDLQAQIGQVAGTTGEGRKIEAVTIHIVAPDGTAYSDDDIEYRVHVSDLGWQDWASGGSAAGEAGSGRQIEAIQFRLKDGTDLCKGWKLWARAHVEDQGWLAWTCDGPIGSTGQALRLEAFELKFLRNASSDASQTSNNSKLPVNRAPSSSTTSDADAAANASDDDPASDDFASAKSYSFIDGTTAEVRAHVQDIGWQCWVGNSGIAGTTGKGKRVEALEAAIQNAYLDGVVEYDAHVQDIGWQDWTSNGSIAGTTGEAKRVEAVRFRLTGELADAYDIWYRVHVQDIGWMGWAENGLEAGTAGLCGRVEAIQVKLLKKGDAAPSSDDCGTAIAYLSSPFIVYESNVQGVGWQDGVADGTTSGTTGQAKRLEAVRISLGSGLDDLGGSIVYRAHVQNIGWQDWVSDGAIAGTVGEDKRCEAIRIMLTGNLAKYFDVIYQAHVGDLGWTGWLADGAIAGTVGQSHSMEALQVKLRFKENYQDVDHWVVSGNDLYHKKSDGSYNTGWSQVDGRWHLFGSDGKNYTGPIKRYGFSGAMTLSGWDSLGCLIVAAAKATPFAGAGYCSEWVIDVFQNAGFGDYHHNDACDLYYKYCNVGNCTANRSLLKPGMIVAVPRVHDNGWGEIYGHIGIYIGDGLVMHNYRSVETWTVDDWFNKFSYYQPVCCGWMGNIVLG